MEIRKLEYVPVAARRELFSALLGLHIAIDAWRVMIGNRKNNEAGEKKWIKVT